LANLRTALGIKANLEMLYLADETFKQKDKTLNITFGTPIKASFFDKTRTDKEWAAWMRKKVHNMKQDLINE